MKLGIQQPVFSANGETQQSCHAKSHHAESHQALCHLAACRSAKKTFIYKKWGWCCCRQEKKCFWIDKKLLLWTWDMIRLFYWRFCSFSKMKYFCGHPIFLWTSVANLIKHFMHDGWFDVLDVTINKIVPKSLVSNSSFNFFCFAL